MLPSDLNSSHRIEIYVGDSLVDLQWKVLTLAQLQLRNLQDLIKPGRDIYVIVEVRT